jgi:hypothetical protein
MYFDLRSDILLLQLSIPIYSACDDDVFTNLGVSNPLTHFVSNSPSNLSHVAYVDNGFFVDICFDPIFASTSSAFHLIVTLGLPSDLLAAEPKRHSPNPAQNITPSHRPQFVITIPSLQPFQRTSKHPRRRKNPKSISLRLELCQKSGLRMSILSYSFGFLWGR